MPTDERWRPPTLADGAPAPVVAQCPCCLRKTTSDMLHPVAGLPGELAGGHPAWCDGCRERAFGLGLITREVYYTALGAPAAALDWLRIRPPG
jgi:hypothetical protein